MLPGLDFDLRAEARVARREDLVFSLTFAGLVVVGLLAITRMVFLVTTDGNTWTLGREVGAAAGTIFAGVGLVLTRSLRRRYMMRLRLGRQGITVTRVDGRSRTYGWTDPGFGFYLVDYTSLKPTKQGPAPKIHPFKLSLMGGWVAISEIPREAFDAIFRLAKENGIAVSTKSTQETPFVGVVEYIAGTAT